MGTPPFVFLLLMGMTSVHSTCVLETDFGLSINCGLKKSGMFRVRNLGGLKGYVGVGLQLADELGFKESLSALEQNNKRRSVNGLPVPGSFEPLGVPQNNNRATTAGAPAANGIDQDRSAYAKMNGRTTPVPPFRPLMTATSNIVRNVRFAAQQQQQQQQQQQLQQQQLQQLQHQQQQQLQPLLKPLPVPAFAALPESIAKVSVEKTQTPTPVAVAPIAAGRLQAVAVPSVQMVQPALTSLYRPAAASQNQQLVQLSAMVPHMQTANRRFNGFAQIPANSIGVRPIIVTPTAVVENRKKFNTDSLPLTNDVDPAPPSTDSLAVAAATNNVTIEQLAAAIRYRQRAQPTTTPPPPPPSAGPMMMLVNAAAANNVSVEQLAMVLRHQQQQSLGSYYPALTTTTTTTTTAPPPPPPPPAAEEVEPVSPATKKIAIKPYKSKYGGSHKVMNAPKEYYPVGYDKNFDDNFVSKVDLPDTSFNCGEQKHFPGLYGDEDLGCMVFHVCAFTDDGLTQKSFLCPESTLFDQTILKCNWWFYVDCKSSEKLYDSNIPISKSYQLMKALTFFSSYSAGPTIDASVAAATAAVSRESDAVPKPDARAKTDAAAPKPTDASTDGWSAVSTAAAAAAAATAATAAAAAGPVFSPASPEPTSYLASTTEVFDNVSFRK